MSSAQGMGIVEAVLASFEHGIRMPVSEWFSWRIAILLLMAVPVMWHMAAGSKFTFAHPIWVVIFGFCIFCTAFTPNLYAQGQVGGGRLADTIYFIWIFWLYAITFYLVGWKRNLRNKTKGTKEGFSKDTLRYVLAVSGFWFLASCGQLFLSDGIYVGTQAAASILSGQAQGYRRENEMRLELLKGKENEIVEFPGFSNPPELLLFQDITYDANDWLNTVMAEYYGKESVRVIP